jgi:predicted outer membrane repeat protein
LQSALAAAASGKEIWVAAGTYKPGASGVRTATFQMKDGVAIYGGFAGDEPETFDPSQRDFVTNETILSGDLDSSGTFTNNDAYHVVTVGDGISISARLDGFTIAGGNANSGDYPHMLGGGLINEAWHSDGNPVLENLIFTGNYANQGAGAYFDIDTNLTLTNVAFKDNYAGFDYGWGGATPNGGALSAYYGNFTFVNALFSNNTAQPVNFYNYSQGGAVSATDATLTFINTTFIGNEAAEGGAVYAENDVTATFVNSILWNNSSDHFGAGDASVTFNVSYSNVQGGASGTGNINTYPLFADVAAGNFRLTSTSPCINAGNNSEVPAGITTDLDGNSRIVNDIVDMGAYEYQGVITAPTITTIDPASGPSTGGTMVTITGTNFVNEATVHFGTVAAASVSVVSETSITATTPPHEAGQVDVKVTNPDSQYATLTNGFSYVAAPTVTTHPSNQTVTEGQTASFTAAATGNPEPTVQWQISTDSGTTWGDINGATSTTYTTGATTLGMNGYQFRAVFTNTQGSADTTAATLTVNAALAAPTVTTHPSNQTVTEGQTASFTAAATGNPEPTVQWQISTDSGTTWGDINGATSTTYTTGATTLGMNGYQFRAVFTNTQGSADTIAATLTVNAALAAPTVTTHPSNQTVTEGQTASFTAAATGNPEPTVQWQISTDSGTTWGDINGATSTTYTTGATTLGMNGYQFRAVFTNTQGSADTIAATLTVNAALAAPTVTTHPSNQTVTEGQTASFTAAATGNPEPTVQWQISTDSGTTWGDINGATSTTYTTGATTLGMNGYQFRAVFTNTQGSADTTAATLTVNAALAAPTVTTHPSNQTVTEGQTASFTAAATGNPEPTVQWQISTDSGTTWGDINGATSTTYTTGATTLGMNGYQYRAVFTNTQESADTTAATLTVNAALAAPTVTTHPSNQTVTEGQTASFTAAATGNPEPTVQWQISTDSGTTWGDINGATSTTYTTGATTLGMNGYQYRAVFTNTQGSADTTAATLTVTEGLEAPVVISHPQNTTVAIGEQATFTVGYTGSPEITFQWQISTKNIKRWSNIVGANSDTYTTPSATSEMNGYKYRVILSNEFGSVTSDAATLTVTVGDAPVVGEADVELTLKEGTYDSGANTVTWVITVTNKGPDEAKGVVVTDKLSYRILSVITDYTYKISGKNVIVEIGTLNDGASVEITIVEALPKRTTGEVTNTAAVTTTSDDPNLDNNTFTATVSLN